jgi:hypothetical protein
MAREFSRDGVTFKTVAAALLTAFLSSLREGYFLGHRCGHSKVSCEAVARVGRVRRSIVLNRPRLSLCLIIEIIYLSFFHSQGCVGQVP